MVLKDMTLVMMGVEWVRVDELAIFRLVVEGDIDF
jgi:hypothetical protein